MAPGSSSSRCLWVDAPGSSEDLEWGRKGNVWGLRAGTWQDRDCAVFAAAGGCGAFPAQQKSLGLCSDHCPGV